MEFNSTSSFEGDLNATTEPEPCYQEYVIETTELKVQAALRSAVGLFSFVCCASVVIVIVLFKKYKFYAQRLILYLSIVTMVHAFSYVLTRVNYYTPRPIDDPYCYFSGALNHYTAANGVLSVWCITLNLLTKTLCNRSTVKAEPIFIAVIFFLPASWIWVPIWFKAYGTAGAWCSIRSLDDDCTPFKNRTWFRFGLWYIPLYILMFVIVISMILAAIRISRSSRKWVGKWDPEVAIMQQTLKREILSLIWYPLIYLLLNTFSLIAQIYDAVNPMNPSAVLIYLRIVTSPLRGAFIALAFGLDRETRGRLRPAQCRAACLEWLPGRRDTEIEDFVMSNTSFQESYVPYEAMSEEDNVIWNAHQQKSD